MYVLENLPNFPPQKKSGGQSQNYAFLKCRLCDITVGLIPTRRLIQVGNVTLNWECSAKCALQSLIGRGGYCPSRTSSVDFWKIVFFQSL